MADDRDGAGAGTAGGAGAEQESVRFAEIAGGADRLDDLVGVLAGDLGAQLVDLADAVAAGLALADDDAVVVVGLDGVQTAEVGDVGIDGVNAGDDV